MGNGNILEEIGFKLEAMIKRIIAKLLLMEGEFIISKKYDKYEDCDSVTILYNDYNITIMPKKFYSMHRGEFENLVKLYYEIIKEEESW